MKRPQLAFLDTNVFVYLFDGSVPAKRARAEQLVRDALDRGSAVISYQVVQEFLNLHTRKFRHSLTRHDLDVFLHKVLMRLCEILPSSDLFDTALSIEVESGYSFYDSLIVASALAGGCDVLLTEDLQHGRRIRGLEIQDPFRAK